MEFEGEILQPNIRAKEKQWRMILEEKDRQIKEMHNDLVHMKEVLDDMTRRNTELKEELQGVKDRYRNYRASVKTRSQE
jgi:regulator of replication initiation timing